MLDEWAWKYLRNKSWDSRVAHRLWIQSGTYYKEREGENIFPYFLPLPPSQKYLQIDIKQIGTECQKCI